MMLNARVGTYHLFDELINVAQEGETFHSLVAESFPA